MLLRPTDREKKQKMSSAVAVAVAQTPEAHAALSRYRAVMDELKALRDATRPLQQERKALEAKLEEGMRHSGASQISTVDGSIVLKAKERTTKRSASKAEITEAVATLVGLDAEHIDQAIESMATRTKRVCLKLSSASSSAAAETSGQQQQRATNWRAAASASASAHTAAGIKSEFQ